MSRHRNIRTMNISDEYEGYDDVYGHSLDDDYSISPSDAAFMYDREGSRNQQKIGAYFQTVKDIAEEDENETAPSASNLSDIEKAKLESCIESINETLGSGFSRSQIANAVLQHNFNTEEAVNELLQNQAGKQQSSGVRKVEKVFTQPKTTTSVLSSQPEQELLPSVKVITSKKATNVTKGFDLTQKESNNKSNVTPRSQSPASGRTTPTNIVSEPVSDYKKKEKKNVLELYKKEKDGIKDHLYMVVIGHVDAGKSTLMGHLLCELQQVSQKTMHKYEMESWKMGKQSFVYAWVLDETGEERSRGITMDVGRFQFETKNKLITLLDAPGHKDFIPNMISGAARADVALMVVDATRGEFETGFDCGGQTREHALLVRSLGVTQLAVAVNKLDTVNWSQERFDEIVQKLKAFLKQAGYRENDVVFVPCSGLTGQNLVKKPIENEFISWYNGPTLIDVIDNFRSPERPVSKPLRFTVNDIFKSTGSNFCVAGRVETGSVSVGDRVLIAPSREMITVKAISVEEVPKQVAFAGEQAAITIAGTDMQNVAVGYILCDPKAPVPIASKFQARIVIFNVTVPITKGFPIVLHHQSLVEPAVITRLISQLNKSTGEVVKKHPRFLDNNTSAIVEIQTSRPIALELYSDCKELGRVMLRVGGVTIAAGLIVKIVI